MMGEAFARAVFPRLDYIPVEEYTRRMKLNELKSILEAHPDRFPRFILPDGDQVPAHFHLTEVGHVAKNFIDCGGTIRKTESSVLQFWVNDGDADHRLNAGKMANILALGKRVLPHYDLEVEVEYGDYAISQFPITGFETSGDYLDFTMTTKHTDCLAREKCGVGEGCCVSEPAAAACC
jgi:hypothetical protein